MSGIVSPIVQKHVYTVMINPLAHAQLHTHIATRTLTENFQDTELPRHSISDTYNDVLPDDVHIKIQSSCGDIFFIWWTNSMFWVPKITIS